MQVISIFSLVLMLTVNSCQLCLAEETWIVNDDFDFAFSIGEVSQHPDLLKYCKALIPTLTALEKKFNREQFIERFGQPINRKKKEYALSIGNLESLSFAAFSLQNKQKRLVESYSVTKNAMVEVYYDEDRKTAVGIMLWFRANHQMPKISKKELADRLKWEEKLFKEFSLELERKPGPEQN